jgi:hypothetical protein
MTDDEIEALMRATYTDGYPGDLRRLVAAVRAAALEEAAKIVQTLNPCGRGDCDELAAAIRARATGNTR